MPVLVTAADTDLGTALVHRLLATGGQVRAYCSADGDRAALRAAGAIVASGDVDDEGRLESALEQVHTMIHLGGGLLSPSPERIVADMATVCTAAANAGVARLVVLSVLGASRQAPDDLRRAKAEVELMAAEMTTPSVVVRTGLVLTDPFRAVLAGTPLPSEVREHEIDVVDRAALVEVLWTLDELRSEATTGHATLVAPGRLTTVGEVADSHTGPGVYRPLDTVPLLLGGLAGTWQDDDPIAADAWEFTGVDPEVARS